MMAQAITIFQMTDSWQVQWMSGSAPRFEDFPDFEAVSQFVKGELL